MNEFNTSTNSTTSGLNPLGSPKSAPDTLSTEDTGIDIWEYLHIIRRRWLLILLCITVCAGATAFVTLRMEKIYRATATLRIETQAPQVLGKNVEDVVEMGTGSFWSNVEYYETQYRIIESRSVALKVVNEFNLHENSDFLNRPAKDLPVSKEVAAQQLQTMLTVEPIKDSRLALVHIDHSDPEKAQLYANAIARAYVKQNLATMHQNTLEAVDWLSSRLDTASQKLASSEDALRKYKKNNDILSISLEDRQNLIAAQMTSVAAKLTEAKATRIEIQSRKNAIAKFAKIKDPMAIPIDALNTNLLIQQLKQNYAQLSQEYGELSARYGDNFPKMVEINAKMERIRTDIAREVNNIITAVNGELHAARATEAGLEKALEKLKADAQELADKEGLYRQLARSAENDEQVYQLLKGRSEEAKLARFLKVNNVEILDPALVPDAPIRPRVLMNLALAGMLGLILGIGLAIVIEFADRTLKTQDDIEGLGVSFLGIIPSIDTSKGVGSGYDGTGIKKSKKASGRDAKIQINYDNFVHDNPKSQVAESLRSIRTNLLFMTADKHIHHLLVTSPSPQEGKTTVAANLAIVMAQSGSRVLLVDTDMRRPRVHKAFGIKRPLRGLSTMILGQSTPENSIVHTGIPNLDVLVCGPTPPNPSELIHTDAFKRVVDDISKLYDRVIFDSPPVGVVTDAAILSKMVDGTLLVMKSLKTTRDAGKHAVAVLKDIDAEILGAVLNDLDLTNRKYGQYYHYYHKKYGYYYGEREASMEPPESPNTDSKKISG